MKPTVFIVSDINSELKELASLFNKNDFNIIISNKIDAAVTIIKDKKPNIMVFYYHNKNDKTLVQIIDANATNNSFLIINNFTDAPITSKEKKIKVINGSETTSQTIYDEIIAIKNKEANEITENKKTNNTALILNNKNIDQLNILLIKSILEKNKVPYIISETLPNEVNFLDNYLFVISINDISTYEKSTTNKVVFIKDYLNPSSNNNLNQLINPIKLIEAINFITNQQILSKNISFNYNISQVTHFLKNDIQKIEISINEYFSFILEAINTSQEINNLNDFEKLRPIFHNLLNLNSFFSADKLSTLIRNLKNTTELEQKNAILNEIVIELLDLYLYFELHQSNVVSQK